MRQFTKIFRYLRDILYAATRNREAHRLACDQRAERQIQVRHHVRSMLDTGHLAPYNILSSPSHMTVAQIPKPRILSAKERLEQFGRTEAQFEEPTRVWDRAYDWDSTAEVPMERLVANMLEDFDR